MTQRPAIAAFFGNLLCAVTGRDAAEPMPHPPILSVLLLPLRSGHVKTRLIADAGDRAGNRLSLTHSRLREPGRKADMDQRQ